MSYSEIHLAFVVIVIVIISNVMATRLGKIVATGLEIPGAH